MSRTNKGAKKSIYFTAEYQSKRYPPSVVNANRYGKTLTHKYERRQNKEAAKNAELISSKSEDIEIRALVLMNEYEREVFNAFTMEQANG